VYTYLDRTVYQAYDAWRFDHAGAENSSLWDFVCDRTPVGQVVRFFAGAEAPEPPPIVVQRHAERKPAEVPLPVLSTIGRISVPRLHFTAMVREGVDEETLQRAVGHIPATALPGQAGNVGVAGHRDTFFRSLRNLRRKDEIDFLTLNGNFRYQVESLKVVSPENAGVLAPTPENTLTMVTCYPFYYVGSAPKRFIVHARQIESRPSPGR
jgi:sortase A